MTQIKAIFFDNDGILIDTEPIWIEANVAAFHRAGFPVTREWYLDYNLSQGKGLTNFLPEQGFSPEQIHQICADRTVHYWEILPELHPMPGVVEFLEILTQKNLHLGIVTAAMKTDFERCHEGLGLKSYFDFIITNEDVPRSKPHPDPYLLALEKSGFGPDEVLVIEDSPRGVRAARAAGIKKVIAVPTEMTAAGDFGTAWRVESDIRSILQFL